MVIVIGWATSGAARISPPDERAPSRRRRASKGDDQMALLRTKRSRQTACPLPPRSVVSEHEAI